MSKNRQQRVDDALTQLVDRTLPSLPDEDNETAELRYNRALERARDQVERNDPPSIAADANLVSDLIKRKLVRNSDTPNNALSFGNLYSRLLAQPVLSQKWAILYLLHQLSDVDASDQLASPIAHKQTDFKGFAADDVHGTPRVPKRNSSLQTHAETRSFDEAFSRQGLSNFTSPKVSKEINIARPTKKPDQVVNGYRSGLTNGLSHSIAKEQKESSLLEPTLLRDLPFTLQGVSTSNFTFDSSGTLKIPKTLPIPIVSLLHALAEPSLLYKDLAAFLESSDGGLVGQSLRAAIGIEARSYLSLVATLEGQIRRALSTLEKQDSGGIGKVGVTLKRCVIWTREATMGLRLMILIVEESRSRKGGQLISLIHSFASSHGDPFVCTFAERLLTHVTLPFYEMLRSWIYDGELSDPFDEFFVVQQDETTQDNDAGKGHATSVWEDKYKLDESQIPTIITEDFARKVFLIGKSLNFIRYGCGDSTWVEEYSKSSSRELRYGDTTTLSTSIDTAYKSTMAHLIHLMTTKFHLLEHLTALKKYLLLGQGDFVALLMDSLASNLDRPANSQYRHTLTAQLEHAIRNSNAQHEDPEVLRRLDARMLELSHGEIGWDVFTLEYKVDAPVDVIVTPHGSKQYLKVFNFLWRIKRVEYALDSTWRRCITGARGVLATVDDRVGKDWKAARCAIAEMIHFVNQLQYYILFEVIEKSWSELEREVTRPGTTLDDLIQTHAKYLKAITRKGLLGHSSLDFASQLHELLKIMLAYKNAVDGLYSFSVAEFTRRQEKSARVEARTAQGKWGVTERDEEENSDRIGGANPRSRDTDSPLPPPLLNIKGEIGSSAVNEANDASVLPALRQRLGDLTKNFHARVTGLLGDLAYQPDMDMRFLGVVMNFNEAYKVTRKSRRKVDAVEGNRAKDKADDGDKTAKGSKYES